MVEHTKAPVVAVAALPRLPLELVHARAGRHRAQPASSHGVRGVVLDDTAPSGAFLLRSVSVLVDASDDARALGVVPGMRVVDAQLHAPALQLDVVHQDALAAELSVVAEVLLACAPVVEPVAPQLTSGLPMAAVALDLSGMVRPVARILLDVQRACARLGHAAAVVASPGTRLSLALALDLARRTPDARLEVRPHEVPAALAALPVDALALPGELAASLHALGARTAADVARLLPRGGVERLGASAKPLLDVLEARHLPLRGVRPAERVVERIELEHPILEVEPLLFVLAPLCSRLCIRARARRERVAEVALTLARKRAEPVVLVVAFPQPLADDKAVLRALQVQLERAALEGPVDALTLEATRLAHRAPQQLALEPGARAEVLAEDALHGLLAELTAELGQGRVGCLTLTDAPVPERMTRLAWPAPAPLRMASSENKRSRRRTPASSQEAHLATAQGRFLAGWPWPLRMLDAPVRLHADTPVIERELLGVLEGGLGPGNRYERAYVVLTCADGRRALALLDDETGEVWLQGWFD